MPRAKPALACAFLLAACGGSSAPRSGLPHLDSKPSFCHVFQGQAEPLVVEWPATDRAKLEALAKSGTVVVSYSDCRLEVLSACRAKPGASSGASSQAPYVWTPLTVKHEQQSISSRDELYAKVPIGAASLEGALSRKGGLEANMTVVGRFQSSRPALRQDEIEGDCNGATHLVRGMTVGAFRFLAGKSEAARAGASAFGAGAGGATSSNQELLTSDGDEKQCESADGRFGPPTGCGAIARLELAPLAEGRFCPPKMTWDGAHCAAINKCAVGTRVNWGSCSAMGLKLATGPNCTDRKSCDAECETQGAKSAERPQGDACFYAGAEAGNRGDKRRQQQLYERSCSLGSPLGCWGAGELLSSESPGFIKDPPRAADLLERACVGGVGHSCYQLAMLLYTGAGVPKSPERSRLFSRRGCEQGDAASCIAVGGALHDEGKLREAAVLYDRACGAGMMRACTFRGQVEEQTGGVGLALYQRACEGGEPRGCGLWAKAMLEGRNTARDPARAFELARRSCTAQDPVGCYVEGIAYADGIGTSRSVDRVRVSFRRACDEPFADACDRLSRLPRQ